MTHPIMNIHQKPTFIKALKKVAILALLLFFSTQTAKAQVGGISYTLSPVGKYTFFSEDAGLKDGLMYGGELGLALDDF